MRVSLHVISLRSQKGWLRCGPTYLPCALGKGGIEVRKREGDGATPAGSYRLLWLYYRRDKSLPPPSPVKSLPVATHDGWTDDPGCLPYNRPIRLPFSGSHERLWRNDRLYDIIGVLDYNMTPAVRGRGSAIFLHQTRSDDLPPTAGCLALNPGALRQLLRGRKTLIFQIPPFSVKRRKTKR